MYTIPVQDVHSYDNKILNKPILPEYDIHTSMYFLNLLKDNITIYVKDEIKMYGLRGCYLIINDLINGVKGTYSNIDEINHINADMLLVNISDRLVLLKNKKKEVFVDILKEICEQFKDMFMTNGTCAAGRSLRFLQIYNIIIDID
jgi:hypothetical protein